MIAHVAQVWAWFVAAFIVGCGLGAMFFSLLARSRFANAQWLVTDGLGRLEDGVRYRAGLAPVYRPRWRRVPPVPAQFEDAPENPMWDFVERGDADDVMFGEPTDASYELALVDDAEVSADQYAGSEDADDATADPDGIWLGDNELTDDDLDSDNALDQITGEAADEELDEAAEEEVDELSDEPENYAPYEIPDELPLEEEIDLPTAFAVVPPSSLFIAPQESAEVGAMPEPAEWPPSLVSARPPEEPPLLVARAEDDERTVEGLEMRRPAMLSEPRNGMPDNLQRVRGIGERNEIRLNRLGIFHFSQIASWTPAEVRWIGQNLSFPERIEHDDWVGQAIVLASGGETGFTKSAERRRARRRGPESDLADDEAIDEN